jgi:hypothetical protein
LIGSGNTREIEFRVTSLVEEAPSAPAYQASTTVRNRPNASIATTRPRTVKPVRSLWRKVFLRISFRKCIPATIMAANRCKKRFKKKRYDGI